MDIVEKYLSLSDKHGSFFLPIRVMIELNFR